MARLERLICALRGHDLLMPELVETPPGTGEAVVATQCARCGQEILGVVPLEGLPGSVREGPWSEEPCLFCGTPTLRSETCVPEMWPCSAVCPKCRRHWEKLG